MVSEKLCKKCGCTKPLSAFGSDKRRKYGVTTACKACRNPQSKKWRDLNPERVKEINAKNRDMRREYYQSPARKRRYRNTDLIRRFGISHDDYEVILNSQGGVCAICKKVRTDKGKQHMVIDHSHENGHIRGVLCSQCNKALGCFCDDVNILKSAIEYLTEKDPSLCT
jgi:hypothetical protein